LVRKGNTTITQILVKWTGMPEPSATWEDYTVLRHKFPVATAWGQAASSEGVMSQLCPTLRQQLDVSVGMLLGCYSDKGEEGRPVKRTIRSLTNVTVDGF
jgi:hypothetical protein